MFKKIEFFEGKKIEGWQPFLNELSKDNATGILLLVAYAGSIFKLNHKVKYCITKADNVNINGSGNIPEPANLLGF